MKKEKNRIQLLPENSWKKMLPLIKLAGEKECYEKSNFSDDYEFLEALGIFDSGVTGELTQSGKFLFDSLFICCDGRDKEILSDLLLQYPHTMAIQQYLWGVSDINVDQVLSVLKANKLWIYDSRKSLTHFLDLLNHVGIIKYNKKVRKLEILVPPDLENIPKNVFIHPSRPFSNIIWIKKILGECRGYIYWLDKHFQKEALEWLWEVADSNKIREIKILSLNLGDENLGSATKKYYKRFKREMLNKGILVKWATIDSKLIRDNHDRWIIGDRYLRNVPNVNTISSGQKSEMNKSENFEEALISFNDYFKIGQEVG